VLVLEDDVANRKERVRREIAAKQIQRLYRKYKMYVFRRALLRLRRAKRILRHFMIYVTLPKARARIFVSSKLGACYRRRKIKRFVYVKKNNNNNRRSSTRKGKKRDSILLQPRRESGCDILIPLFPAEASSIPMKEEAKNVVLTIPPLLLVVRLPNESDDIPDIVPCRSVPSHVWKLSNRIFPNTLHVREW